MLRQDQNPIFGHQFQGSFWFPSLLIHSFIHSFIQQICIEHLLRSRYHARLWECCCGKLWHHRVHILVGKTDKVIMMTTIMSSAIKNDVTGRGGMGTAFEMGCSELRTSSCCLRTPTKTALPDARARFINLSHFASLSLTRVGTVGRGACTRKGQSACSLKIGGSEDFDSTQAPPVKARRLRPIGVCF